MTKRRSDVELLDARDFVRDAEGAAVDVPGDRPDGPAVAAPARHRRHVPGPAAQEGVIRVSRVLAAACVAASGDGARGGRMPVTLRPMLVQDAPGVGAMHHQSWIDTYGALLPADYFATV